MYDPGVVAGRLKDEACSGEIRRCLGHLAGLAEAGIGGF